MRSNGILRSLIECTAPNVLGWLEDGCVLVALPTLHGHCPNFGRSYPALGMAWSSYDKKATLVQKLRSAVAHSDGNHVDIGDASPTRQSEPSEVQFLREEVRRLQETIARIKGTSGSSTENCHGSYCQQNFNAIQRAIWMIWPQVRPENCLINDFIKLPCCVRFLTWTQCWTYINTLEDIW